MNFKVLILKCIRWAHETFYMKEFPMPLVFISVCLSAQEDPLNQGITELDALTIESTPLSSSSSEVTQAWSVVSGEELEKARSATIAETLKNQPGIRQTFFGPIANRPIIRGLDRHRVRMLSNGVETFDFSASSEDHAVSIDPMFIERIELLRGSSALLYGSNAIGGAVNVIDRSIPNHPFDDSAGAIFRSGYTDVNDGWNAGAFAYAGTDSLSFQINGFEREFEDYRAPDGFATDTVDNSKGGSHSYGAGGSFFWEGGYAGLSLSQMENVYGIPGAHAANDTRVEMESDRIEARSEIEVVGSDWLRGIELNLGYGDYRHDEVGLNTSNEFEAFANFLREGVETRIALIHQMGPLRGALGFHGLFEELKVGGEENLFSGVDDRYSKAIASENSRKLAVFLVEEFDLSDDLQLNGGVRLESFDREFESEISDRDDWTFSASGGISRGFGEGWSASANLNYSERAPETSELYSNGPHHGSETFDVGNPSLNTESAIGLEIILRRKLGNLTGQLSAFWTQFDDYVYPNKTPVWDFDLGKLVPHMVYTAADADFRGLEAEIDWRMMGNPGHAVHVSVYGDLLRGRNETRDSHLPRIPPARVGLGFDVKAEKYGFGLRFERVADQNRVQDGSPAGHWDPGPNGPVWHGGDPFPTEGYSLLNAFYTYTFDFGQAQSELYVAGSNLTDNLAKVHTSFLKGSAPLPGRTFEVGLKVDF